MIRLSIITVVYNDLDGLRKTTQSIDKVFNLRKESGFLEHVIIDGGSTDGTKEYLENLKNKECSYNIKWISECDSGIYDAMNKGVNYSSGNFLVFVNADDEVYSNIDLTPLRIELEKSFGDSASAGLAMSSIINFSNRCFEIKPRIVIKNRPRLPTVHQSMIFKKEVLLKYPFDPSYKICGDYDNFSRIYNGGMTFNLNKDVFSLFYAGGESSESPVQLFRESFSISKKYFDLNKIDTSIVMLRLIISLVKFQILIMLFMPSK